ncbi:MAG TPA: threonine synthase [Clostridia bacterium]|nr:threonine synthase [Clostridia bacterium]
MMYISTRDNFQAVTATEAIKLGMVPTGGLFVPQNMSTFAEEELKSLIGKTYQDVAAKVLAFYLDDYSAAEIVTCLKKAYQDNFTHQEIAPLYRLADSTYILELWHGPTAAFKDMALQLMPHLLSLALQKLEVREEMVILVATSGDTGKAALEGFKDVSGLKIVCFYPYQGVSAIQERQMITTEGENTYVVGVRGNFDDCQNTVKTLFGDQAFRSFLAEKGFVLSSANSINWGRLLPQIVYYVYAYLNLVHKGRIKYGEKINFVVPTGNFGNILAAWYAYRMGLPLHKLICASNENKVLTDFFRTGIYEKNRPFKQTNSPSMDILISSNLERFLYEMTGREGTAIATWMSELQEKGRFVVDKTVQKAMSEILWAGFATEKETLATIKETYLKSSYLLDTHTAVGMKVYQQYVVETGDKTVTVLDSTASPFKFVASVLQAFDGSDASIEGDEFALLQELSQKSGWSVHPTLQGLEKKPILHQRICAKERIRNELENILGLR